MHRRSPEDTADASVAGACSSCGCDGYVTRGICRLCADLRDRFAAAAMQGLLSHYGTNTDGIAGAAYAIADAMLAARAGNGGAR